MPASTRTRSRTGGGGSSVPVEDQLRLIVAAVGILGFLATIAAAPTAGVIAAGGVTGHGWAWPSLHNWWVGFTGLTSDLAHPAAAYGYPSINGPLTWAGIVLAFVAAWAVLGLLVGTAWRLLPAQHGLATAGQVRQHMGTRAARQKATITRPGLQQTRRHKPAMTEVAVPLGNDHHSHQPVFAHHEDSILLVAAPRTGKTAVLAGLVADAPGPVVAASTKADLPAVTWKIRAARAGRPVAVFDPEDISGWPEKVRWSPVAGCEDPSTALRRAAALVQARPITGTTNGSWFAQKASTVLRCLLHAAALDGQTIATVRRWAGDPTSTGPRAILHSHSAAADGWDADLLAEWNSAAGETLASITSTLTGILDPLADPALRGSVDCSVWDSFNIGAFLDGPNTLYVMSEGTTGGLSAIAATLINEVHHVARHHSQRLPGGRLDPPLRFCLDEVANIGAIPDLSTRMSDSGGRGITMILAATGYGAMQRRWSREEVEEIKASATVRLAFGGSTAVDDLQDMSRLLGDKDDYTAPAGSMFGDRPGPIHPRRIPVLPPDAIREIPAGQALLLSRSMRGTLLDLTFWWKRRDHRVFRDSKNEWEQRTCRPAA